MNREREQLLKFGEYLHELLCGLEPCRASGFSIEDLAAVAEEFLAEVSARRWVDEQLEKTRMKSMDFTNGAAMGLIPSQEIAALWVGACRGLLQNAPNYSETKFDGSRIDDEGKFTMETRQAGSPEVFTVTIQRHGPGKLTPHEARLRAEDVIGKTWKWISDVNDGLGYDTGDLGWMLEQNGFPPPSEGEGGE